MTDVTSSKKRSGGASRPRQLVIARAYKGRRWLQGYIGGKLFLDPVFDIGLEIVRGRGGRVVDLGCGLGLFALWLREHGCRFDYRGSDLDAWKINAGRRAAAELGHEGIVFLESDILDTSLEGASTVCAFDVLHYLPPEGQELMLRKLGGAARRGALVLVRTAVRDGGWRSWLAVLQERWIHASGWIRSSGGSHGSGGGGSGGSRLPRLDELVAEFESLGCRVEVSALHGRMPFSNHLLQISSPGEIPERPSAS